MRYEELLAEADAGGLDLDGDRRRASVTCGEHRPGIRRTSVRVGILVVVAEPPAPPSTKLLGDRVRLAAPMVNIHVEPEVALVVQTDGRASRTESSKRAKAIIRRCRWVHRPRKNFYDEDSTPRSPAATVSLNRRRSISRGLSNRRHPDDASQRGIVKSSRGGQAGDLELVHEVQHLDVLCGDSRAPVSPPWRRQGTTLARRSSELPVAACTLLEGCDLFVEGGGCSVASTSGGWFRRQ